MLNETPIHSIESLFQIDFDCHETFFTLRGSHEVNNFLSEDNIITRFPTGNEVCLQGMDKVTKVGFKSLNENFCDSFVKSVTQANWSELVNGFRFVDFWNEADEG